MPPHRIRLRGFWTVTPLADGGFAHRRSFGRPQMSDPSERAWLVCDTLPGPATITMNGEPLGSADSGTAAFDVTERLLPRNELVITLTGPGVIDTLDNVALEMRSDITG